MSEELKACPFCGGKAQIESRPSYSQAANTYECHRGWCDDCGFGMDWCNHEPDAIAAWNRRTPDAARVVGREDWQDAVEHLQGAVQRLSEHLAALLPPASDGWRGMDSAPKDGTCVLLWGVHEDEWEEAQDEPRQPEYRPWPAYVSIQKSIWWIPDGMRQVFGATHWRPLPAPPVAPAESGDE